MNNEITIDGVVYVRKEEAGAVEEPKPWPQVGDNYYYLDAFGDTRCSVWNNSRLDASLMAIGSIFKIKEEAEKVRAERTAITTIKNYAREKWGEFEPDWEGRCQHKYYIYKSTEDGYSASFNYTVSYCPKIGHFRELAHAEEIIEKFTRELDVIFS